MKRCPRCGQIYTDDLLYCLQDGNELLTEYAETETPTVVRPPRAEPQPTAKSYLKYLAIALIALLAMGFAGAVGAYFVWNMLGGENDRAVSDPAPRPTPTATAQPTRTPAFQNNEPQNSQANIERPAPPRNSANTNRTAENDDEPDFVDPGPTRINFRRGRVSETVSGRVSKRRDFVLRTSSGQNLTARINSERNCVVFPEGRSDLDFVTPQGDSRLTLINNCPATVPFRMNVTVR